MVGKSSISMIIWYMLIRSRSRSSLRSLFKTTSRKINQPKSTLLYRRYSSNIYFFQLIFYIYIYDHWWPSGIAESPYESVGLSVKVYHIWRYLYWQGTVYNIVLPLLPYTTWHKVNPSQDINHSSNIYIYTLYLFIY